MIMEILTVTRIQVRVKSSKMNWNTATPP
ncbi:hypothetical protein FQN60_011521 [Etheostoma spectabile]|uniref:Uncharacterized protein n=1 Tax=Etheostoma spectabile TaxID=54343 RepID=A0A5J5CAP9_9PERO|nr:hypothetical protein FQN60_011521 [Etheostoma spectabile]